ncbi:hypothetical protein PFLmoz3_06272 [Pseudomonas fluorescens]|uniref:Uncharacterized protein n=1 Tax=Pseudomonas fluorescens TaxID=294 RepID=A0A109KHQ5_PSEFL|nr:hypothetical protein PFLmoz3_06272 [Pseudomonas fluorescens]
MHAYRQLPDQAVRSYIQADLSAEFDQLATVISEFQAQAARQAKDDILQNAQIIHEHEMLVDHANTFRQGLTGRVD